MLSLIATEPQQLDWAPPPCNQTRALIPPASQVPRELSSSLGDARDELVGRKCFLLFTVVGASLSVANGTATTASLHQVEDSHAVARSHSLHEDQATLAS